jgi:hypothetical protein
MVGSSHLVAVSHLLFVMMMPIWRGWIPVLLSRSFTAPKAIASNSRRAAAMLRSIGTLVKPGGSSGEEAQDHRLFILCIQQAWLTWAVLSHFAPPFGAVELQTLPLVLSSCRPRPWFCKAADHAFGAVSCSCCCPCCFVAAHHIADFNVGLTWRRICLITQPTPVQHLAHELQRVI